MNLVFQSLQVVLIEEMSDRTVPASLLSLSLPTRALNCHQCKGFGGCLHASRCPRGSNYCVSIATRVPFSVIDLPLVTKSCYSGCPDVPTLGLGPHVSIVCCQFSLCNTD
uniref:Secreted Ly-6/uPAR domain-containing protein 2 n=1 Tax=Ailuropoda melanoleuca TaxID=9646 RepID=G1L3K1_AILME